MKKVLVRFEIPDDCDPSIIESFIITNNYDIALLENGVVTDYALELIEKGSFPLDVVRQVFDGEIAETDESISLHPTAFDDGIIEALKKNPFWNNLTAETYGNYYFSK